MKKYLLAMFSIFAISACAMEKEDVLKGKNFVLLPDKTITISFDDKENRFYGQALNNYFGNYAIEGENISFSALGSTMMAGPEEEMEKESQYFQSLATVKQFKLDGKTLELKGDKTTLTYEEK